MHEVVRSAAAVCEGDFTAKRQRLGLALQASAMSSPAMPRACSRWSGTCSRTPRSSLRSQGEIRVVTSNVDDHFVLVVADTGIGISAEALPLIFDAFAQEGQWVTSEFGGLGLGLAIAKATVEAHHGTLVVTSGGRNQGATFTVTLPLD